MVMETAAKLNYFPMTWLQIPNHNSVEPNVANDNSRKASIHSTRSHIPVHNMTDEPPQHPLDEEALDNIELPELETQVPVLHQFERVSVPPSDYIP